MKKVTLIVGIGILLFNLFWQYQKPAPIPIPLPTPVAVVTPVKSVINITFLRTATSEQIAAAQISFVGTAVPTAISQIDVYRLDYQIDDMPFSAQVYFPAGVGPYPLFVFGAGTTGLADKCAPSLENTAVENIGNYDNHMLAQASQGYIAVLPDYQQTYFISQLESNVLLGAVNGLVELYPNLNSLWLAGYSQGGHAALSTAANWQMLPPQVQLKGVVQYGGAADVEALFMESPWLAPYLVDSFVQHYGSQLDPQLVLQGRWLISLAKNNAELCVNQVYRYYPHDSSKIYNPVFLDAIQTHTWPDSLAAWQQAIIANTPETNLPDVPYLFLQGEVDPIVAASTQRANVAKLCQQGKAVSYREYSSVNHFQVRQASFIDSNAWMRQVMSSVMPGSDCPVEYH